ncbi:MAG TPA: DUF4383 domain-containing protein [Solirubrobacterales bacterium]|nr:DUF4383 domain-containing protein [Solirubrobacterales bacterium]
MQARSPAHLYATVAGGLLAVAGLAGFFYEASFATGDPGLRSGELLGVIAVNGWANLLHLACGLVLLAAAAAGSARSWALGFGLLFVVLAIWGFAGGEEIAGLIPSDLGADVARLVLGLLGLGAGAASPEPQALDTAGGQPRPG